MNYTIKLTQVNVPDILGKDIDKNETDEQFEARKVSLKGVLAFAGIAKDNDTGIQIRALSDSFYTPDAVLPRFLSEFGKKIVSHEKSKPKPSRKEGKCTCAEAVADGKVVCAFCASLTEEEFVIHSQRGPEGLEDFWTEKGL